MVSSLQETILLPYLAIDFLAIWGMMLALVIASKAVVPGAREFLLDPRSFKVKRAILVLAGLLILSKSAFAWLFDTDVSFFTSFFGDPLIFDGLSFLIRP